MEKGDNKGEEENKERVGNKDHQENVDSQVNQVSAPNIPGHSVGFVLYWWF